jgi:hypothetical protein
LRPDNAASHPELLDSLAKDFVAAGYDVRHLLRCLANSSAYQRTSRSADDASSKRIALFGQRPVKLMSADMLFESLKLATGDAKLDLRTVDPKESSRFGESTPIGDAYQEFSRLFETNEDDATDFTHGIPQLLALPADRRWKR